MELEIKQKPLVLYVKNEINTVPLKRLSKTEIDLFFYLCFCLNEKESEKITLTFNEIKKILGFQPTAVDRIHKLFLRTYKKLLEINFTIEENDEDVLFPVFYEFKISRKLKTLSVQIHPRFQYVLNNFKFGGNFTRINLLELISLKLDYAKKLYPILKQFHSTGQVYLRELNEWRKILYIPEAYDYRLINKKILTPIVKELSKYFLNLKLIKKNSGRKITHIGFEFEPLIKEEVKSTIIKDKKTPTNSISGVKEECSIVHKNIYEENNCQKIHILNNNNFFADDNDEIVWD